VRERGRDPQRTRVVVQVALRTGWSVEQVRDLTLADFDLVVQEISGKRRMSEDEILQELKRWQVGCSRSSSARTPPA